MAVDNELQRMLESETMSTALTNGKTSDVNIEHLDYGYIGSCTNVKYLESILKVLRSGKEGLFPELIEFAENRLKVISPNSKLLNLPQPIKRKGNLASDEQKVLSDDLDDFLSEMKSEDCLSAQLSEDAPKLDGNVPIRGTNNVISKAGNLESNNFKSSRIKSGDYRAWDKFDVDEECEKIEQQESHVPKIEPHLPSDHVQVENLPDLEIQRRANIEKEKGNESFRAGDYDEAIVYYSRSLKFMESAAVFNNRCLAYLKKEDWKGALAEADRVLQLEEGNLKALLRKTQAFIGMKDFSKARASVEKVLQLDESNKAAVKLKQEIDKKNPPPTPGAKRIAIEECDEDEEELKVDGNSINTTEENVEDQSAFGIRAQVDSNCNEQNGVSKAAQAVLDESDNGKANGDGCPKMPNGDSGNEIWEAADVKEEDEFYDCSAKTPAPSPPVDESSSKLVQSNLKIRGKEEIAGTQRVIPDSVMREKNLANRLYERGQYHEAMLHYSNAIDNMTQDDRDLFKTAFSALWSNRAACHLKMGDLKQAISDCDNSFSADDKNAKVLVRRSACYQAMERHKEAFVDLKKAIEINASLFATVQKQYNELKQCLITICGSRWSEKLPKFNQYSSESDFEKFNRLKGEGNECVKNKDYMQAIKLYSECIDVDDEKPVAYANRAQCFMCLNKFEDAERDCDSALDLLRSFEDEALQLKVNYRRCMARKGQKKFKSAMDDLAKVMKQQPKIESYRRLFTELMDLHRKQLSEAKSASGDVPKSGEEKRGTKVRIVEIESDEEEEDDDESGQLRPNEDNAILNSEDDNTKNRTEKKLEIGEPNFKETHKQAWESTEDSYEAPVPTLTVQSPYEFTQAWVSLKQLNDTKAYALLLDQVDDLSQVVTIKMDADMLSTILRVLHDEYMTGRETDCLKHLENLSKVPRLSFLTMFLSESDKNCLTKMFDHLSKFSHAHPESDLDANVGKMRTKFKC